MAKVKVCSFSISADGYGAGAEQSLTEPLGHDGERLHDWIVPTRGFQQLYGKEDGTTGIDDDFGRRGMEGIGAWILGRNMFGPVRGPWPDDSWRGWWGEEPPYHVPVFVLTHHAREPIEMKGGTTFHFVTGGADEVLARAKAAAGDRDIRIGGGVATLQQYLRARAIDELHIAVAPVLLGRGEALFAGIDLASLGYEVTAQVAGEKAVHLTIARRDL